MNSSGLYSCFTFKNVFFFVISWGFKNVTINSFKWNVRNQSSWVFWSPKANPVPVRGDANHHRPIQLLVACHNPIIIPKRLLVSTDPRTAYVDVELEGWLRTPPPPMPTIDLNDLTVENTFYAMPPTNQDAGKGQPQPLATSHRQPRRPQGYQGKRHQAGQWVWVSKTEPQVTHATGGKDSTSGPKPQLQNHTLTLSLPEVPKRAYKADIQNGIILTTFLNEEGTFQYLLQKVCM